jgi:hypothetical protein
MKIYKEDSRWWIKTSTYSSEPLIQWLWSSWQLGILLLVAFVVLVIIRILY